MKGNTKILNSVVLCGFNGFNAYGMLRSLGEAGISPILVINRCAYPFLSKSRYATNEIHYFDNVSEIPGLIRRHIKTSELKPIIICCEDAVQSEIDNHYDEFKDDYLLSNCKQTQGEITRLMEKDLQMEIAAECGVLVPKTWKIRKGAEIPTDMIYPCIAKPIISIKGSKMEITVCGNRKELKDVLNKRDYLVQEFVEKDYEIIIWGTSVGKREYYIPGIARKIRQYPDDNSLSSYGVLESLEQHKSLDTEAIFNFLRELDYQGMFSIEMAVKSDRYYFLEINLRNDGKQYFSTAAGANLPLLYIKSLINEKFSEPNVKTPTYFMGETTDFKQIFRKKVSLIRWIRDLCRTKSFFVFNWKDPKSFICQFIGKLSSHIHR